MTIIDHEGFMNWVKAAPIAVLLFMSSAFAESQNEKEWTLLVYINGHNNLSSFGDTNIIEMEKVGSTKDLNIVVEWGSTSNITKRLYLKKSNNPMKVVSPSVKEMTNYDMGDYKNLESFIEWGVKNYPAKHYFVAVWNHGAGWQRIESKLVQLGKPLDISFDDNFNSFITTEQMGLVMANIKNRIGRNIDIHGSDACLMQMIEVAGEMKDSVDYFVGSQETEPGEGWPYGPFLEK